MRLFWTILLNAAIIVLSGQVLGADNSIVYVGKTAPFSEGSIIAKAIVDDCNLPQRQIGFVQKAAADDGAVKVVIDDEAVKAGKGRVLFIEIVSAVSGGNTFVGHHKQVAIRGRLLEDGVGIGSFTGVRQSMGGAFAGFKGSCSVLGRCVQALGQDVAQWLKRPEMNSRLGD